MKLWENFVEFTSIFACINASCVVNPRQVLIQTLFLFSSNSSFNSVESATTDTSGENVWLPSSERLDNGSSIQDVLLNSWLVQSRLFHPPSDEHESPPPGGWRRFLEMWEPSSLYATTPTTSMSTISAIASTAATAVTASTSTTTTLLPFSSNFGPFYFDNPLTGDCPICLLSLTYDNCIPLHESTHPIHVRCLVGLLSADDRVGWSGSDFELSCPSCRAHVRGSIMIHT